MFKQATGIIFISMHLASHAYAVMPLGEYLDGGSSKSALILAHGQGGSPTSHVVDPIRKEINKELGMHTLSLQMPVVPEKRSSESYLEYEATFPDAYKSIQAGIDFMKDKGVKNIYLMGYSMGARMATAFLADHSDSGIAGYIGVGMLGGGQPPLNTNVNLRKVAIPVLDIYADNGNDAKFAEFRKNFVSNRYTQISIEGAKHDFRCCESSVSRHVVKWLREQDQKN
jgi:predicted alpha/beta-hydrolase family hydrolase